MNTRLFLTCVLITCSGMVACGGDKKGPKSPESNAGITETSAKEDMPPPPAKEGDAPSASATDVKIGGAAGGMLKLAAMKFTPAKKGKNDKTIELKADGTIMIDGKPAAKIKGDQVDSTEGLSMLTVGVDGSLVGNRVKPGFKFDGDDIAGDNGLKLTVGDDGAITATKEGKNEALGKAEGGGYAKRAALVVAILWMSIPTTVGETAKTDKKPAKTSPPATKK